MSESRRRKSLDGVARSRRTDRWRATSGWSTTVTPVIARGTLLRRDLISLHARWTPAATSSSRRTTRIPAATLERALAAGAEDRGLLRQRDTYFAVARRAG